MKAVRCKDHKACLAHVPVPAGEGVRVRIAAAGICGSDLHMIAMGFPLPFTLGHEIAGVVEAVGPDTRFPASRTTARRLPSNRSQPAATAPAASAASTTSARSAPRRCSALARTAAWPRR